MSKGMRVLKQPQRASYSGTNVEETTIGRDRKDSKTMGRVISFFMSMLLLISIV
jgi:hypothetical protein